jgi:regulation of enolase protein 1 (concanavalin A-like superfamily)
VDRRSGALSGTNSITYSLINPGYVSLNIYDGSSGEVVREMKHTDWQGAGTHVLSWDGTDNNGNQLNPNPPKPYAWKLIELPAKLNAQYLLSIGSNYTPGTKPTSFAPGGTPISVAVDGGNMYVGSHDSEITNALIKQTRDGSTRLWDTAFPTFPNGTAQSDFYQSLAVANGVLFALGWNESSGPNGFPQSIYKLDPATGVLNPGNLFSVTFDDANRTGEATVMAARLAADGSTIFVAVAYARKDLVRLYDQNGNRLSSVQITAPQGVTVDANGTMYVSKGQHFCNVSGGPLGHDDTRPVAEIDAIPFGGTPAPFITANITTPTVLDIDTSNNTLLVYDGRAYAQGNRNYFSSNALLYNPQLEDPQFQDPIQQIKRFNLAAPSQAPTVYGALGGRVQGPYNKANLTHVSDVKADGSGGFYVVEYFAAPHRVAHFTAAGTCDQEFYGGTFLDPPALVDPDDPTVIYLVDSFDNSGFDIMRVIVNYAAKTSTIDQTYAYGGIGHGIIHFGYQNTGLKLVKHAGTTYIAQGRSGGYPQMVRVDPAGGRLVPVTATNSLADPLVPQFVKDAANANNPNNQTFQWNDLNGDGSPLGPDGKADPAEFQFYTSAISLPAPTNAPHVDTNGDFYEMDSGSPSSDGHLYRFEADWSSGSPRYLTFPNAVSLFSTPTRMQGTWAAGDTFAFHDTQTHEFYVGFDHSTFFTANDAFLSKWSSPDDKTYTYNWTVGRIDKSDKSVIPTAEGGKIANAFRHFVGTTHGCYVLTDVVGIDLVHPSYPAGLYVWDRDGLWVGNLFDTTGPVSTSPYEYQLSNEVYDGTLFTSADQQTVYLIAPYTNESRIYQITGFDGPSTPWVHLSGTVQAGTVAPTMAISYNGNSVTSDAAPQAATGTDFQSTPEATNLDHTFTITNTGTADLELTTTMIPNIETATLDLIAAPVVTNTGTYGGDFIVIEQPMSRIIPGASTRLTVRFVPSAPQGGRSTVLGLLNNSAVSPFNIDLTGTGTTNPSVQTFVTQASGVLPAAQGAWAGMQFHPTGAQPLTVPSLGRWVLPGMDGGFPANSQVHEMFLANSVTNQGGATQIPASRVFVQTNGAPANAFQFASLRSPLVLPGGADYYIASYEPYGGDASFYWDGTSVTGTSVADIVGAISTQDIVHGPWKRVGPANDSFGPTNFKYELGTITAEPTFSPVPGTYTGALAVTIADATPGATIKYTTDGTTPTETHGNTYSSPVSITATTTLAAIAFAPGSFDSYIPAGLYTVNHAPTINITSPASGVTVLAPGTVAFSALATDSDSGDSIDRVEYYDGSSLIATLPTTVPLAPYQFTWTGAAAGSHSITARAYDKQGGVSTSAPVVVNVLAAQNVGTFSAPTTVSFANGTFTIDGGGTGMTGTADAFYFIHVPVSGDRTVTALVNFASSSSNARAGVMIRQGLATGSAHASTLFKPAGSNQQIFTVRSTSNGSTSTTAVTSGSPFWLRIQRTGNTFRSFRSSNGTSWSQIGSDTTVTLNDPVELGLAVASGSSGGTARAFISNVTITQP